MVMTRIEDSMAGTEIEAAPRIEVVAEVVDEVEVIIIIEVAEGGVLVEAEVVTTEEGEVGKEEPINRLTTWAPVVVATMRREASQITMITYRVGTTTMRRFLPWAAEAYLTANKSVRHLLAKVPVCATLILRTLDERSITMGALIGYR